MKTKFVFFIQPSKAINYGIGTYMDNIISCFHDSKFDFEIVELLSQSIEVKAIFLDGYRKILIPNLGNFHIDRYRNYYSRNIAFLLKSFFSDKDTFYIFHLNYMDNEFLAIWLKKIFKCKVILTTHYTEWSFILFGDYKKLHDIVKKSDKESNFIVKKILTHIDKEKKLSEACDHLICPAHHTSIYLREILSVDQSKISIIPHGLSDQYSLENRKNKKGIRQEYYLDSKTKIILFAGRLDEIKGTIFLINAFKKILETNKNTHLFIAGDGDFHKLITASQDICTKVTFTGKLDKQQLYKLYNIADIGVICSIHEEFGYVALEMMMHAIPLIITDTSGLTEIVEDNVSGIKTSIIIKDDKKVVDLDVLSEKINILLNNPALKRKLGQNGRKRFLEKYQFPVFSKTMLDFYNNFTNFNDKNISPQ
ncbi:MAG: TIGR04157 family glycosyltransferase [Fusobacteriaceae bacterium]|jgi:glycosyltransferase|nr:TIGR04157 family glycosyltransferase [Fusobacteriaceae bacterium]